MINVFVKNKYTRHNLHTAHADLFEIVKSIVHRIMHLRWVSVSRVQDQAEFCRTHRDELRTIFPVAHLNVVPLKFLYIYL